MKRTSRRKSRLEAAADAKDKTFPKQLRIKIVHKRLADVAEHPRNPRIHAEEGTPKWNALEASLVHDYFDPLVFNRRNGKLVSGAFRKKILTARGVVSADMVEVNYDERTHYARMIAANEGVGENDDAKLVALLREIAKDSRGLTSMPDGEIEALLQLAQREADAQPSVRLADRFGVPPFSVLDARQGYWQQRKRAWLSLGIRSEIGRGGNLLKMSDTVPQPDAGPNSAWKGQTKTGTKSAKAFGKTYGTTDWIKEKGLSGGAQNIPGTEEEWTGTSIFDPVLCELAYRWFCPRGGRVLDPFAGGSVRGVVAGILGRGYHGVDLRAEQVAANEAQWKKISGLKQFKRRADADWTHDPKKMTPVEERGGYYFKRDDLFTFGGANGGKVRVMLQLLDNRGAKGLVTCGDRTSTQISRAAQVARALGIPARIHTATGEDTPGMAEARSLGAEIIQHEPGYLTVVKARAKADAAAHEGWVEIPWGLVGKEAVEIVAKQFPAAKYLKGVKRIVVPVGSGTTLAGVLTGMVYAGVNVPVLGVQLGGDVQKTLSELIPNWRKMCKLVKAKQEFSDEAPEADQTFERIILDPIYEAKCVPFLKPGDLLWIVGRRPGGEFKLEIPDWTTGDSRNVHKLTKGNFDFLFTCPPYYDLEVYSEDPADLSTAATYEMFLTEYRQIIRQSCDLLSDNRFAAVVVGDIRDKATGNYRNFVSETIAAFRDCGLELYNEAILVTAIGSLPIRIGKQFEGARKLGKTHQQCLVFIKGDARKATEAIGPVEFGSIEATITPEEITA